VSDIAGLTTLNTTKSVNTKLLAADTTDVNVSGATGAVVVDGGKDIAVTTGTANKNITIGAVGGTSEAAGTITVTNTDQGTGAIKVDGGTDVTVTTTADGATGTITVGDQAGNGIAADESDIASGTITITQNLEDDGTGAFTGGAIATEGGTDVNITVNANSVAEADTSNAKITVGTISVVGGDDTTTVTVTQNDNAETFTSADEGGATETASVKFGVLKAGDSLVIDGLTFTASKNLTAEEVAAAFANLTNADTQTAGGKTANGFYTGILTAGDWTSGAATGDTVVFTNQTANSDETDLSTLVTLTNSSGNSVAPTVTDNDGAALTTTGATSSNATVFGAVTITDGGTDSITTVTVDGFANASSVISDALATLTLRNNTTDGNFTVTNTTVGDTLALTLDNITSSNVGTTNADVSLDGSAGKITTLTVNTENAASAISLIASGVTDLTINAAVGLNITGNLTNIDAVEEVDINGAGAVNLGDISGAVDLNTFDASGNTGGVTATIEAVIDAAGITGDLKGYTFSEGDDVVTLTHGTGNVTETNITLGAGDDTLNLATGTTSVTGTLAGGTGTNTIAMAAADATVLSNTATFEAKMSDFSKISLGEVATTVQDTLDLANMDDISYVITAGDADETHEVDVTVGVPSTAISAGDTASITINGITYTTVALGDADANTVIAGALATAINGKDGLTAAAVGAVVTVSGAAGQLLTISSTTITGNGVVASTNATTSSLLTIDNMANNGTVEITDAATGVVVNMTDASGDTDTFNIVTGDEGTGAGMVLGTVSVADVETINVTTTDTFTDDAAVAGTADDGIDDVNSAVTLTVAATSATTVNVDGAGDLTLYTSSTVLETVDATDMTGVLTYVATLDDLVVNGGSGNDILTASGDSNVINGGAGNDTLTAGDLAQLTGGAGIDTFTMVAGVSVSKYATIKDASTGDKIDVDVDNNGTYDFISSEFTFAPTAGFTDILNQAIAASDAEDVMWFQYESNTYILVNESNDTAAYDATKDSIIMLEGEYDLSTASFNTSGIVEIA
jgi:S-layer protein